MDLNQTDKQSIEMLVKQRNIMKRIIRKQNKVIEDLAWYLPDRVRKAHLKDTQAITKELDKLDAILRGDK